MGITTKAFLRKSFTKEDGTSPLYLRITIDRKHKEISLNKSIDAKYWDEKKCKAKKGAGNAEQLNHFLIQELNRANDIIYKYQLRKKNLTLDNFANEYKHGGTSIIFITFCDQQLEEQKSKYAYDTMRGYISQVSKLKTYKPNFSIFDITYSFLIKYEEYMRAELGNNKNTIHTSMKFIRAMMNIARKKGLIEHYPFDEYTLPSEESNRAFLTIEELKELEELLDTNLTPHEKNVLKYFLFCCYTGLRYADVNNVTSDNIKCKIVDNAPTYYLDIKMQKTNSTIPIPLTDKALKLVDLDKEGQLFRVVTNQKSNQYLKGIITKTSIDKRISFHCARHTFATIALTIGIPIEVVKKLLGHKSIITTEIYAKIVDEVVFYEMRKMNSV